MMQQCFKDLLRAKLSNFLYEERRRENRRRLRNQQRLLKVGNATYYISHFMDIFFCKFSEMYFNKIYLIIKKTLVKKKKKKEKKQIDNRFFLLQFVRSKRVVSFFILFLLYVSFFMVVFCQLIFTHILQLSVITFLISNKYFILFYYFIQKKSF